MAQKTNPPSSKDPDILLKSLENSLGLEIRLEDEVHLKTLAWTFKELEEKSAKAFSKWSELSSKQMKIARTFWDYFKQRRLTERLTREIRAEESLLYDIWNHATLTGTENLD